MTKTRPYREKGKNIKGIILRQTEKIIQDFSFEKERIKKKGKERDVAGRIPYNF